MSKTWRNGSWENAKMFTSFWYFHRSFLSHPLAPLCEFQFKIEKLKRIGGNEIGWEMEKSSWSELYGKRSLPGVRASVKKRMKYSKSFWGLVAYVNLPQNLEQNPQFYLHGNMKRGEIKVCKGFSWVISKAIRHRDRGEGSAHPHEPNLAQIFRLDQAGKMPGMCWWDTSHWHIVQKPVRMCQV